MGGDLLGGQAVVEGVLMLNGPRYAIAVRGKGDIELHEGRIPLRNARIMRIPFVRGITTLLTTLWIGLRAMTISTQAADDEELSGAAVAITVLFSLFLALALFKFLPLFITDVIVPRDQTILFNVLDGVLRIGIFLGYLLLISRMQDVKRMFAYHGAEHKVINAFERTGRLRLGDSREASRLHARCSTSFVVLVLVVAVIVFAFVPLSMSFWPLLGVRALLLLPIAGISYEIIRLAARTERNLLLRTILVPGYWVQRLTTREPDDDQLRVALAAARAVV